jgi:hypothetical protein
MSMRKDREITIIRESTTKSSRPVGRLSVSLTEALLGDSLDSLLSLREEYRLDEKRVELDGHTKETTRYLDQHPEFRELAKSIPNGKDRNLSLDIDGVPIKQTHVSVNKKGIPRAYSDVGEAKGWNRSSSTTQEPVIEIVPTTTAPGAESGEPPPEDVASDNNADDLEKDAKEAEEQDKERWQQIDDREQTGREYDTTFSGPGGERVPVPSDDDRPERDTDVDTTNHGDGNPGEDPQQGGESGGAGPPAGEPEGGDVVNEPPGGQGGGENPPPPPADDIESVKNYIDQVAQDRETVDLSERKLPMHKRSLTELLYSTKLA